jgi:26S proteasome regulatory subunit N7
MRLVAYRQYLESFKSVTIENMARAFGVTQEFLDSELSNFIYNGKINCKIDKVQGVIESNRPNRK